MRAYTLMDSPGSITVISGESPRAETSSLNCSGVPVSGGKVEWWMGTTRCSAQKLDGQCRLAWVHREPAADGQEAQIGRIQIADDLHVAENGGIARVVNPFSVLEGQNEARRLSGVDARIVDSSNCAWRG